MTQTVKIFSVFVVTALAFAASYERESLSSRWSEFRGESTASPAPVLPAPAPLTAPRGVQNQIKPGPVPAGNIQAVGQPIQLQEAPTPSRAENLNTTLNAVANPPVKTFESDTRLTEEESLSYFAKLKEQMLAVKNQAELPANNAPIPPGALQPGGSISNSEDDSEDAVDEADGDEEDTGDDTEVTDEDDGSDSDEQVAEDDGADLEDESDDSADEDTGSDSTETRDAAANHG